MRFSVIMASYLGNYRTAAKDRDRKILRAIDSVIKQTFEDWELIIIADGCKKTVEIVQGNISDKRISLYLLNKGKLWGGAPRNFGIDNAKGDYILYLDIDDIFGENHMKNISSGLNGYDWVWFDDVRYSSKLNEWYENKCDIRIISKHGTSNICHRRELPYRWDRDGYAHDYYFIKHLKQNTNYTKVAGGKYYICHIPNSTLGKGYDL